MKAVFVFSILTLLNLPSVPQTPAPDDGPITVLSFKWSKISRTSGGSGEAPLPARAVSPNDKNFERTARVNDPAGMRDPNADTLDVRGQELEKSVRSANNPKGKASDAFSFQAKIRNRSQSTIEIVFWEYQFGDGATPGKIMKRQFMCGINLKPDKEKELQAVSILGPTVNAATAPGGQGQERAVINRVEFADGKSWMRKDWNAGEIQESYKRVMATPWSPNEVCRAL